MLRTLFPFAAASLASCIVCACAATPGGENLAVAGAQPPGQVGPNGYILTEEELKLDCKKLTGRMQVRILQIRDYDPNANTTGVARTMQQGAISVFGGSTHGMSPDATNARDRAVLEAYNRQLAAKKCPTFNLDEELKPKPVKETPRPVDNSKK
jgi:hypothetical protein